MWTLGAVIHELVFDGVYEGCAQAMCQTLFSRIQTLYEQKGTTGRITSLTVNKFNAKAPRFHCLSSKAAEARDLLPIILDICREQNTGSLRDGHRIEALESLCGVYDIFKTADIRLTDAEAASAMRLYEMFLLHYNALLHLSIARGERCYNFVFKLHHCWHIVDHARWINPRVVWCYEFEDFIGVMTAAAKSCIGGSPMTIIGNKVLDNYLLVLILCMQGLTN
ncbi:hypothetical protein N9L68_01405 [bacterium]|nr:hypothetical protein [bacterium]